MRHWRAVPLLLAVSCSVHLEVPEDQIVVCASDADCPSSGRCNPLRNVCDFNTGSSAPAVAFNTLGDSTGRAATMLPFDFDALDANAPPVGSDVVHFSVEYSIDGSTWCTATILGEAPAIQATPTQVTLTWDALTDAARGNACPLKTTLLQESPDSAEPPTTALAYTDGVRLKLTATDSTNQSSDLTSVAFAIGNDAPVFAFDDDGAVLRLASPLEYELTDSSNDTASLDVQFQIDGDASWYTASLRGSVSGLVADPLEAATSRFIVWNADAALVPGAPSGIGSSNRHVTMRGRAVEASLAGVTTYGPWSTITRDVRNQTPPVVGNLSAYANEPGFSSSLVVITYKIADAEDDAVDVRVQYSDNGGASFKDCSPYPTTRHSGTRSLPATADNTGTFTFIWDAGADLTAKTSNVVVAVTAADDGDVGSTATTTLAFVAGHDPIYGAAPTSMTLASTSSTVTQLALADFNGDGVDDYVVLETDRLEVFIANTATHLPTSPSRATASGAYYMQAMDTADFNEDGKQDVVVWSAQDGGISIVFGTTSSSIALQHVAGTDTVGTRVPLLAVGDFDADGHRDIASIVGGKVAVSRGLGNGTFQTPVTGESSSYFTGLAAGDFNGDGCDDLAYGLSVGGGVISGNGDAYVVTVEVRVLFGERTGPLVDTSSYAVVTRVLGQHDDPSSGSLVRYATLLGADVLGTGRDALLIADREQTTFGRLQLFTYDTGFVALDVVHEIPLTQTLRSHHSPLGDFIDVIPASVPTSVSTSSPLYVWDPVSEQLVRSRVNLSSTAADWFPTSLTGSGNDLVQVAQGVLQVYVEQFPAFVLDDSFGLSRTIAPRTTFIVAGDMDGDELADLAVIDGNQFGDHLLVPYTSAVDVSGHVPSFDIEVAGNAHLIMPDGTVDPAATDQLSLGDFDGNGVADLVTDTGAKVFALTGATTPFSFDAAQALELIVSTYDGPRAIGDFNGDGCDDLAHARTSSDGGSHVIAVNYGAPSLTSGAVATPADQNTFPTGTGTLAGDVDNDGVDDVVVIRSSGVRILFGTLGGALSAPCDITLAGGSLGMIGDINDDGRQDLIVATGSAIVSYAITRCAASAAGGVNVAGGSYQALRLRDVDGDGHADLLATTTTTTDLFLGTGSGIGARQTFSTVTLVDLADMNGDALPELFTVTSAGTLGWRVARRVPGRPAWQRTLDAAHVVGAPAYDRFGEPWSLPVKMRRTIDAAPGLRDPHDSRRDFSDSLRHSGVATRLTGNATAVTDAWMASGDLRAVETASGFEVTAVTTVLGASEMLLELPVVRGGTLDPAQVRVYGRLVSDYERDGEDVVPRLENGLMRATPVSNWTELVLDTDGDITTGTGPRFTLAPDSSVVHIATPALGVFRAYVVP